MTSVLPTRLGVGITRPTPDTLCKRARSLFSKRTCGFAQKIRVYAVPRGGMCALLYVSGHGIGLGDVLIPVNDPEQADLIFDDLIDSGRTRKWFARMYPNKPFDALFNKLEDPADRALGWIQFPWEIAALHTDDGLQGPEDGVVRLLQAIGEDVTRDGLKDTPKRVVRALREMTSGYQLDPKKILGTVFEQDYDEFVILKDIPFSSLCEHHMLPFTGTADVGYLPSGRGVVGLSKLARLVDAFAKRLQLQERLTKQVAEAISRVLHPQGVGVVIRAAHSCMACRGVTKSGSEMVTSCMLGLLKEDPKARSEFLSLIGCK